MTLGRFDNATASDISAGLAPPTSVRKSDVDAVRKNYGIDAGFKPKGLSDTSLYSHSVKFVLDWWKKNSPEAIATQQAAAAAAAKTAAATAPKAGTTGAAPAPIAKPGTVIKPPATTTQQLAPKPATTTASSYLAPTAGSNPTLSSAGRTTLAAAPLTTAQATSIMTQMGYKGVTPPKTALVSTTALRTWVTAQLKAQATAPATRQQAASLARTAY